MRKTISFFLKIPFLKGCLLCSNRSSIWQPRGAIIEALHFCDIYLANAPAPPLVRCLNLFGCDFRMQCFSCHARRLHSLSRKYFNTKIFVALPTNSSSLTSIHHLHGLLGSWVPSHLVGPQESVLLNSWHQKSLKQGPQQYGEQLARTWNPESRDGGLYLRDGEHQRDRRRGSKNVNGAEEAKDIMEEEKKIRVTKKVGEEINQWLSAFLGCWESPWHQSFAKQSYLALISFSPSLIEENVWLNMFPYLSPLQESPCRPIKKSNISVCPSSEVGSIIPVIFSGGPQYEFLRYLSTQQSKQSLSLPYFPCSSLTLALS